MTWDDGFMNSLQKRAHDGIEYVFRKLFPEKGLAVRSDQVRLSHEMLDTIQQGKIALCDAGVGIGKTYAYLVACIMKDKYTQITGNLREKVKDPVVISTSSIALQEAIIKEYIPFLSDTLIEDGFLQTPLRAVVRKGKEHFVCDSRLEDRIYAVRNKKKNEQQKQALLSLRTHYDMDDVQELSNFDRRLVCVPKFCPQKCPKRQVCRYHAYLKRAKTTNVQFQICNHNYLLADAMHRTKGYRPLLSDYQIMVVDEAHKLPEAAKEMFGLTLCYEDIEETAYLLEKECRTVEAGRLRAVFKRVLGTIRKEQALERYEEKTFHMTPASADVLQEGCLFMQSLGHGICGKVPKWILAKIESIRNVLECFYKQDSGYILYLKDEQQRYVILCATSRNTPAILYQTLWTHGVPAILTSGTLKAGNGFGRTRQENGLAEEHRVLEYVADSPFDYQKNCLLYIPQNKKRVQQGSNEEAVIFAKHISQLICKTCGHTLVLFTSYSLMGNVCQILRDSVPFPMIEVWRNAQEEIMRFKKIENAVLFAAGSCWEGVDFPGDIVSSLIIVKLPFAVPDPLKEAERQRYNTLSAYIRSIIVPDMQKRLRQGFGRAIRTEEDTCVVSILDHRAAVGGKYHKDVLQALPSCQMTNRLEDVETFIRRQKREGYYM